MAFPVGAKSNYTEIHHPGRSGERDPERRIDGTRKAWRNQPVDEKKGVGMQSSRARLTGNWVVLCGAALCCSMAWGQHVWLDERGVKQYSDKPPPASVPDSRIIRPARNTAPPAFLNPAATPTVTPAVAADNAPAKATDTAPAGGGTVATTAQRNIEFNKRRAQQAESDKKAGDQQKLAQEKAANCERAAGYKRTLESGARVTRIGKNGEQAFIGDEQRVQELKEAAKLLEGCA